MRRPRGGQISVQGRWRHAEPVGHVSNGNVGIGEQRPRYVEIVTNAVKYAFPGEAKGTVVVTLKRAAEELRLTVADDGQGLDPRRADSGLGGRLVDGFAQQLGGQVERKSDSQGTAVHLILPSRERS
jgi:two-component sensor histidine kinase